MVTVTYRSSSVYISATVTKTLILWYLDVVEVDTLVVVGVDTLDDVDTDDEVEIELDVHKSQTNRNFV